MESRQWPATALVFYHDKERLDQSLNTERFPDAPEILSKLTSFIRDLLERLCGLRDFSHVIFKEDPSSLQNGGVNLPLAVVVGTPDLGDDGELRGIRDSKYIFDLLGTMTARAPLPGVFANKLGWVKGENLLCLIDAGARKVATRYVKQLDIPEGLMRHMPIQEQVRAAEILKAMAPAAAAATAATQPVDPADLPLLLPLFLAESAGVIVGPIRGGWKAVTGALAGLRKSVWRIEDIVVGGGRFILRTTIRAARPLLIGFIAYRALNTIGDSKSLPNRLNGLTPAQALDTYFKETLGADYEKQIEDDMRAALAEVDEGLLTDDYVFEKRLLTAAMIRQLEVEDWDKERMKHYYYGSHGMGPWYLDMEERLRNPYFVGARAWNGPIEGWVGKNQVFPRDLPEEAVNFDAAAIRMIEDSKGVKLTAEQKQRIVARQKLTASEAMQGPGGLLHGVLPATNNS